MNAPYFPHGAFGDATSLWVALVIGIGFGFCLERAGFGSARKLVSQFYLNDMAVFKVMFTAILTAMVGVVVLGAVGFLDRSMIYTTPTFLWPQIVGGLVLGAGFVIGGYCPGTSLVGVATGRWDALVFVFGVAAGTFVVAEADPWLKGFMDSGSLGTLTLPELFHLPEWLVVAGVVVIAVAGFAGAQWVERRVAAER